MEHSFADGLRDLRVNNLPVLGENIGFRAIGGSETLNGLLYMYCSPLLFLTFNTRIPAFYR